MMRALRVIPIAAAVALTAACSSYNKLLNSKDYNRMYERGLQYYQAKDYRRSLQLFEESGPYFVGTMREDSASFYLAASNYNMGYFETSSELFETFRFKYGRSKFIEEAEYLYAMGFYYSSPAVERDQSSTVKAINSITEYMARYPATTKKEKLDKCLAELTQKLWDKEFQSAYTYYKIERYKSAVVALKNALNTYPESNHREELMYLTAKSSYLFAAKSYEHKQRDRYMSAMDDYYNFISEYPESKYRRELDQMQERSKKFIANHGEETEKKQ
ncbi:MAG: outer membrane protein assembly factor BamD [Rikenellaceae bacterium]|jgi:outer membrane protein assembly factor BamD|nr:outer membrane protein assembly factor BamD [Rikenellaceae bacterium]